MGWRGISRTLLRSVSSISPLLVVFYSTIHTTSCLNSGILSISSLLYHHHHYLHASHHAHSNHPTHFLHPSSASPIRHPPAPPLPAHPPPPPAVPRRSHPFTGYSHPHLTQRPSYSGFIHHEQDTEGADCGQRAPGCGSAHRRAGRCDCGTGRRE